MLILFLVFIVGCIGIVFIGIDLVVLVGVFFVVGFVVVVGVWILGIGWVLVEVFDVVWDVVVILVLIIVLVLLLIL